MRGSCHPSSSRLTLEAVSQVPAPQHPRVEAERVPVLRAEEALRGDLQRVQRQPAGALCVCAGLLQHHVREQSPAVAPLEAGAEHSGGSGRVQGVREAQRRGPDGLLPGAAAVAASVLPDQRLDGEALLVSAVLEHREHRCRPNAQLFNDPPSSQSRSADSGSSHSHSPHGDSPLCVKAQIRTLRTGKGPKFPLTCARGGLSCRGDNAQRLRVILARVSSCLVPPRADV